MNNLIQQMEKIFERLERLEAYVNADAFCPCCEEEVTCLEDCTFEQDDNSAWEKMMYARDTLKE